MTTAPQFIIHASGSRRNPPDLGKRAYRLRCQITVGNGVHGAELRQAVRGCLEHFVKGMHLEGFEWLSRYGWRPEGMPVPHIEPREIRIPPRLTAKQMLPAVKQGARFLAKDETIAWAVPSLEESIRWDYIVSGVFVHDTLVIDVPYPHEEERV